LKKLIASLIAIACLASLAMAQDPGVFLPFYFVKGDVTSPVPASIDGHEVVYFNNHPMVSEKVTIGPPLFPTKTYMMNIMRARYFSKFNVQPGETYQIGVAKGSDNYGKDPFNYIVSGNGFDIVDIALVLNEGGGLLPPDGTVPLDIVANGADIDISWDQATYGNIDLYRMTGAGSGQYVKDGWAAAQINLAGGIWKDIGTIAQAPKEIYYKALLTGQSPAADHPDYLGQSYLAVAWAVGKFDIDLLTGFNLASTPMIPLHGNDIDDVFLNASGGGLQVADTNVYYYNESTEQTIKAEWTGSAWSYSPNVPFDINLGTAYWVELTSSPTVSMLGAIIVSENHRLLGKNSFSLMSSPTPTFYADLATAGLPALGDDEIYLYDASTQLQAKMENNGSGVWINAVQSEPAFGLIPGVGYWYKNNDANNDRDWILVP